MKILYVVQRYGEEIVGGSEAACRQFAEHLVHFGHEVTVLTSCAKSYVTWENDYSPGESFVNGVRVVRLPVVSPRIAPIFGAHDQWLMSGTGRPAMWEHERWARLMGPNLSDYRQWLVEHHRDFDVAVFMTYLYTTATLGITTLAGRLPVVFQPTAHKEPPLKVPIFDAVFRLPDAYVFFTPEERDVVRDRFGLEPHGEVIGIGIEQDPVTGDSKAFRTRFHLGEDPYLVYVGRLDPMKGVSQLCNFFIAMKGRRRGNLKLVLAGDPIVDLPQHEDLIVTGFLEESEKQAAIAGAVALVQSSYFESFSIVLCEAWVQGRPALVQGMSPVLSGQAERSRGALAYHGFAEFEENVHALLDQPEFGNALGRNGKKYVETMYNWPEVITRFSAVLEDAIEKFAQRPIRLRSSE